MKKSLKRAIKYIKSYCDKQYSCHRCALCNKQTGCCRVTEDSPINWTLKEKKDETD